MNRKQTLAAIRAERMAVTYDADCGEYRVTFGRDEMPDAERREAVAYYTPDSDDAYGSALHMRRWADTRAA